VKAISASILVLASAVMLTGGAFKGGDDGLFLQIVGGLVGLAGFFAWYFAVINPGEK